MPTVTLNKSVFEKLVGKELPIEELKKKISYLGTALESIEGNDINVEIFPNRPDLLSEQGLARAFSSFIGLRPGIRKYDVKKTNLKVIVDSSVSQIRPFTVCAIVKDLKFDDEKIKEVFQVQEKLHMTLGRKVIKAGMGIYPLENLCFPLHYTTKKPEEIKYKPLNYPHEASAREILMKHPKGKEHGHIINKFDRYPVFINGDGKVMCLIPIVNSSETGQITQTTKDVFIEFTGTNLNTVKTGLNIIVTMLADMGGEIYSVEMVYPDEKFNSPELTPKKRELEFSYVNKILGTKLKEKEIKELLLKMGYDYEPKDKSGCIVHIPPYRADIMHQIDFVEDIAIAYGYDKIEPLIPEVSTVGKENPLEVFKRNISEQLLGLGLLEICTYNLTSRAIQETKMNTKISLIEIKNPSSEDFSVCRAWVLPSLMQVLSENTHNEYPQNIFGYGEVFEKDDKEETGVHEDLHLAVALCNNDSDFTKIKQIADAVFNSIDSKYLIDELEHSSFISGRCGKIIVEGVELGFFGEVSPDAVSNFGLEMPVCAWEINLTKLFKMAKKSF